MTTGGMSTEQQLLEAIYLHPEADEPRLVYADFLSSEGSALGEFIALQVARARRGKRTKAREQVLLASESAKWWSGHPVAAGHGGTVPWDATARGFPAVYNCGWSVDGRRAQRQAAELAAHAGAPGWATVETLHLHWDTPGATFGQLLASSPFRSLKRLAELGADALEEVGALPLPVESLELWNRDRRPLARIAGFPHLKELLVDVRCPAVEAVKLVTSSGVLPRLARLELRGVSATLEEALAAFALLPPALGTLCINQYYGQTAELSGARRSPQVRLSVTAAQVDEVSASLQRLPGPALATIEVEFAKGGFFTKRNTPALRKQIDAATRKWRAAP